MKPWRWITAKVIYAVHDRQIAERGGLAGVRDVGAIESTLTRPADLASYAQPDAADLSASYAFGFARNHGFVDGNKCISLISARLFLLDNGYTLRFDTQEAITTIESLASGGIDEAAFASWIRSILSAV